MKLGYVFHGLPPFRMATGLQGSLAQSLISSQEATLCLHELVTLLSIHAFVSSGIVVALLCSLSLGNYNAHYWLPYTLFPPLSCIELPNNPCLKELSVSW